MPKIKRLRHGVGAKISVYKRFLRPRAAVCAKYPNASKNDVLDDLLVIGQEEKVVCKRLQGCIMMRHADFDDGRILHAVTRFCKVQQEGPIESLFERPLPDDLEGGGNVAGEADDIEGREIPSILNEDISNFRAQGFAVDNDNEPAPENIPSPQDQKSLTSILRVAAAPMMEGHSTHTVRHYPLEGAAHLISP
jgi:hypothetical protein